MTLTEFRKQVDLVAQSKAFQESDLGKTMLQTLEDSHIRRLQRRMRFKGDGDYDLGLIHGYDMAVNNLLAMAHTQREPTQEIEPDWTEGTPSTIHITK